MMAAWAVLPSTLTGAELDEYNVPFSSLAFVGFVLVVTTMSMVGSNKTIQPENLESMCKAILVTGVLNLTAGVLMRVQVDDENLLMRRFADLVARETGAKDSTALTPIATAIEAVLLVVGLLLALAVSKHGKALASTATKTR